MKLVEKIVYSSLIRNIDQYIEEHNSKPKRAIMNKATNKRLVAEIHQEDNKTVLEINTLFGINIDIQEKYDKRDLYNNEIIVLSK